MDVKPVVNRLEKKYAGKIIFLELNLKDQSNISLFRQYKGSYIPLFIFYNSKGKLVESKIGSMSDSELEQYLAKINR